MKELILDESIPRNARKAILDLNNILAEKDTALAEKDAALKVKDFEKNATFNAAAYEVAVLQRKIEDLTSDIAVFQPRSVIEYVEVYIFPADLQKEPIARELKWESFFKETQIGQDTLKCISKKNRPWFIKRNPEDFPTIAAKRVQEFYSYNCQVHHDSATAIHNALSDKEPTNILKTLEKANLAVSSLNMIKCIAEACSML